MANDVGIYCITNKINGKVYIGQSHNLKKRLRGYKYKCHNTHLRFAFKKYGLHNFYFGILIRCNIDIKQDDLDVLENDYIIASNSTDRKCGYNYKSGGLTGKHSLESIEKMIRSRTGKKQKRESIEKMLEWRMNNYKTSEETKAKISKSNTGKKRSNQWIERQRLSHVGKPWSEKRRMAQELRRIKHG